MPLVVKAGPRDSTLDLIKKFKKLTTLVDIVQITKDNRYYRNPSSKRAVKTIERKRLRKRTRSLKKMKNISPAVLQRLHDRLNQR